MSRHSPPGFGKDPNCAYLLALTIIFVNTPLALRGKIPASQSTGEPLPFSVFLPVGGPEQVRGWIENGPRRR